MNTKRVNLLHLEQFYEVAKVGNVSTGARKLRISQPALSKSIRLLEESLGAKLFERTKRGVFLTPAGKIAFDHSGRIFSEAGQLRELIESEKNELAGDWSLGASDNLAIYLLPPIIAKMKSAHPGLRIQLFSGTSGQIKEELYSERCDVGLFFTPPSATEALRSEKVLDTEFWVVIGKRSPWAKAGKNWTIADLKKGTIPAVQSRQIDYAGGFPAHFHSRQLGLPESVHLEANLHEVKKRLVLEGAGYAVLVRHSVEEEVRRGELIRVPTPARLPASVYWVTRRGRAPLPASAEFRRLLAELSPSSRK